MSSPVTVRYENRSGNRDFNIFNEEYFGGADAFIYINGKREHQIAHIQFALQERQKPVYGYASHTYDALAVGDRLVVGAMKIPVVNTSTDVLNSSLPSGARSIINNQPYSFDGEVPPWVYNYDIHNDEMNEINNPRMISSTVEIYEMQSKMNIDRTGHIDFNTKLAVANRRVEYNLSGGCYVDIDFENTFDDILIKAITTGATHVYASPYMEVSLIQIMASVDVTVLAISEDFLLIRESVRGYAGYVRKEDVRYV